MAWRKWRIGLVIALLFGLLTAGSGLAGKMDMRSFIAVLCTALLTNLGSFLKTHPVDALPDELAPAANPKPNS